VVEDLIIPFAAYSADETPNVFQWVGQPQKIVHSSGGISTPN